MFKRHTSLAAAFMSAAIKKADTEKVDHHTGAGNWIARRVAINALDRPGFAEVTEFDKRPTPPKARVEDSEVVGLD